MPHNPQNLEIREINCHECLFHQNYKFQHRHHKSDRQKHNSTLTPTFKLPGQLTAWIANTPNLSLLQVSRNKNKNKRKGQVTCTKVNFTTPPLPVKSSNPNQTSQNQSNNLVMQ